MKFVAGHEKVIANLKMLDSKYLKYVGEAVEQSCVIVADRAKADHNPGLAHSKNRYANRTTNLTNSIAPRLIKVSVESVEGEVGSNLEYAAYIEAIYPYLGPALIQGKPGFKKRLHKAVMRAVIDDFD